MIDEIELDSTGIQVPKETLEFLRSIDRPETVLMLFDLYAYGFAGVTGVQTALLARFLARETRFMTLRAGGHYFYFMDQVLDFHRDDDPSDRFEFFLTREQCRYVEGLKKAKVHVLRQGEITADSSIARMAMELDFQRDTEGRAFAEWVFRGKEEPFRGAEKTRVSDVTMEFQRERGSWTVEDMVAVFGFGEIRPATHILHMGGVFGAYEGEIIRRAACPSFNALGMEYPFNVVYRDPDMELSPMKGGASALSSVLHTPLAEYDEKRTWFEFKETETGLAVSINIDPYAHYHPDDDESNSDDESVGFPKEVEKNAILFHGFATRPDEDDWFGDDMFCDCEVLAADIKELHRLFRKLQARGIESFGPFPERDAWGAVPPFSFFARREENGAQLRLLLRGLAMIQTASDFHVSEERLGELCDYFGQLAAWFPPLGLGETRASRWAPYREPEEYG